VAFPSTGNPRGIQIVAPSVVAAGEIFELGVKLTTEPFFVGLAGSYKRPPISVKGPFNLSHRGLNYMDNVPPAWEGRLEVIGEQGLNGPTHIDFAGENQGPYVNDPRPIRRVGGFRFTESGTHFIHLRDPATGLEGVSNPIRVESERPKMRLFWGDIHGHTLFTDAIRMPEEMYAFARDEAFMDVCALTDHSEGISDLQWRYFTDVTNSFNAPGRFATLVAGEWTSMIHGHRNYYYRGDQGPIFRSTLKEQEDLQVFYDLARAAEALVVPHHSANSRMGVDWSHGHAPDVERLVEIHSIWGNSERPAEEGNEFPIRMCQGEKPGQHVRDALRRGYRLGMIGSGDIHDGRPGDCLSTLQTGKPDAPSGRVQGFVGIWAPELTREAVFDALWNRRVFATMKHRTILLFSINGQPMGSEITADGGPLKIAVEAAADRPIRSLELVGHDGTIQRLTPDRQVVEWIFTEAAPASSAWYYIRLTRDDGTLAWSSPIWVDYKK
jgi:hypothetical protein